MSIVELLSPKMIIPTLKATNKVGVIKELASHAANQHREVDGQVLEQTLASREELSSTAIGDGVAIPHAKLESATSIFGTLARARDGIDFDSSDGQPTYLFFMLVAPVDTAGQHLMALARVSRLFRDENFKRKLLEAAHADEMFELISAAETMQA